MSDERDEVAAVMQRINDAWLANRGDDLTALVHEDVVMVLPGFAARIQGREQLLAGFRDFAENAKLLDFSQGELQADVAGATAVVTFDYEMTYERSAAQYRVTGRDLWVFEKHVGAWLAVWRTMLDLSESAV